MLALIFFESFFPPGRGGFVPPSTAFAEHPIGGRAHESPMLLYEGTGVGIMSPNESEGITLVRWGHHPRAYILFEMIHGPSSP